MTEPNHSNVIVFPPLIPMTGFLAGVVAEQIVPAGAWIPDGLRVLGAVLLVVGLAGFAWMVITMKRARTPIHNAKMPTTLVETGPFRWTRNPMYLFGSTGYAGLALVLANVWSLALLPVVVVVIHFGVVLREEQFLARRFGDVYEQFRRRVPRWV